MYCLIVPVEAGLTSFKQAGVLHVCVCTMHVPVSLVCVCVGKKAPIVYVAKGLLHVRAL